MPILAPFGCFAKPLRGYPGSPEFPLFFRVEEARNPAFRIASQTSFFPILSLKHGGPYLSEKIVQSRLGAYHPHRSGGPASPPSVSRYCTGCGSTSRCPLSTLLHPAHA